jgi:hypothetical protein
VAVTDLRPSGKKKNSWWNRVLGRKFGVKIGALTKRAE